MSNFWLRWWWFICIYVSTSINKDTSNKKGKRYFMVDVNFMAKYCRDLRLFFLYDKKLNRQDVHDYLINVYSDTFYYVVYKFFLDEE